MKRNFTLTELLIVIVIISLLTAMAFPIYSAVLASVQNTSCQNNLRTMYKATMAYANANTNKIPAASRSGDVKKRWMYSLTKFESEKMLICPADATDPNERGKMTRGEKGFENPPYGYNGHFGSNNNEFGPDRPLPSFTNPSRTILIADVERYMVSKSGSQDYRIKDRHNEKANVLFLDGSVINNTSVYFETSPDNADDPFLFTPFRKSSED